MGKLVIFDCDGTLVETEFLVKNVLSEALEELGCFVTTNELVTRFRGGVMSDFVAFAQERLGENLPTDFEKNVRRTIATRIQNNLPEVPGAKNLLTSLKTAKCVASNAPLAQIEASLFSTGLLNFFNGNLFSAYEVGSWKPSPDLFLFAAEVMKTRARECIVVEDSVSGVEAGISAGMQVCYLKLHASDTIIHPFVTNIDSLDELAGVL